MDLIGGAQRRSMEDGNINRTGGTKARAALLTPRSASVQMDEALMRLEIFEEKATLLVINDLEEEDDLHRFTPGLGQPKGLDCSVARKKHMFAEEFETKRVVIMFGRACHGILARTL
ncbi:hypothetical protein CFC21_096789 [Triticum aestivum]|uniref:Uncharacterized protein n=2 Tax=Triticum aestivum TaxID=4565 RepID=A0A3B6RFP0_WHEAT|nr:hypothetical protein CFC21_096789 [Triticum aestivum]